MDRQTLVIRVAEALKATRPMVDGPEMRLWGDLAVALAAVFLEMDSGFDRAGFFLRCGGL